MVLLTVNSACSSWQHPPLGTGAGPACAHADGTRCSRKCHWVRTKWRGRTDFWLLHALPNICKAAVTNRYDSTCFLNFSSHVLWKSAWFSSEPSAAAWQPPGLGQGFPQDGCPQATAFSAVCFTNLQKGSVGLLVKHLEICKGKISFSVKKNISSKVISLGFF